MGGTSNVQEGDGKFMQLICCIQKAKSLFQIRGRINEDNIRKWFWRTGCGNMDWVYPSQDWRQWRSLWKTIIITQWGMFYHQSDCNVFEKDIALDSLYSDVHTRPYMAGWRKTDTDCVRTFLCKAKWCLPSILLPSLFIVSPFLGSFTSNFLPPLRKAAVNFQTFIYD